MASKGKIVVVIIHYNTPGFLKGCLQSVVSQTYEDLDIIFIDNASPDRSGLDYMHAQFDGNPKLTIISNSDNKGYAKAANQGIKMAIGRGAEFVSIVNPDIIFTPDYFEKIIEKMKKNSRAASAIGKVYKYDFNNDKPTDIIDTTGLLAYKNRRVVDRGQGVIDEGKFNEDEEVFGVSGACPVYRIKALEDVKIWDEYFDEDFFMYKEDVDLSWRFLLYGWKNLYLPEAVAYHGRGTGTGKKLSILDIIESRGALSKFQKKLSFQNQLLMVKKNDLWSNFFKNFHKIFPVMILTPFYITFKEPYLWGSYLSYLKKLPRILRKRAVIMKNKKVTAKEMDKWFK